MYFSPFVVLRVLRGEKRPFQRRRGLKSGQASPKRTVTTVFPLVDFPARIVHNERIVSRRCTDGALQEISHFDIADGLGA